MISQSQSRIQNRSTPVFWALVILLAACWWILPFNSIGHRLGMIIYEHGWDSGPPDEYAYDFVLSWHFALCCIVYCWMLQKKLLAAAGSAAIVFPFVAAGVLWIFPWNSQSFPHKVFGTLIYLGTFVPVSMLARAFTATFRRLLMLQSICAAASVLFFVGPILGGNLFWITSLAVTTLLVGWTVLEGFTAHYQTV